MLIDRCIPVKYISLGPHDPVYVTPLVKLLLKKRYKLRRKGRNVEADALALRINQITTQTRSNQYSKMTEASPKELCAAVKATRGDGGCQASYPCLPFFSISIVQIITLHQYAVISIILVIVWLIFSSPLLMKIAKYLLLCMKVRDYCIVSNLVHQALITYLGGFITTALMRLPMWLHIFWICPFPAALYPCSGDKR